MNDRAKLMKLFNSFSVDEEVIYRDAVWTIYNGSMRDFTFTLKNNQGKMAWVVPVKEIKKVK